MHLRPQQQPRLLLALAVLLGNFQVSASTLNEQHSNLFSDAALLLGKLREAAMSEKTKLKCFEWSSKYRPCAVAADAIVVYEMM